VRIFHHRPGLPWRAVVACLIVCLAGGAALAADSAAGRQQDLDFARSQYVLKSRALSAKQRQQALDFLWESQGHLAKMSAAEFLLTMARIPAFADNAHDVFNSGKDAWWPDTRLPFRLVWFPDGLLIARVAPERTELLGARITRIEGLTPEQLLTKLHAVCGGTEAYRRWNAMWVITNGQFMHALGLAKSSDRLQFSARLRDGRSKDYQVDYVPVASVPANVHAPRLLSADLTEDEAARHWSAAVPADSEPLYLQQPEQLFRRQRLADLDAFYLQLRSNMDEHGQLFKPFLDETLAELRSSPTRNLIFDLRFNTGGDISVSRDFLREVTQLIPGRIYVLISRYTFSAGIVSVAALKHDAADRAILVGEPVGDRLRFWSEGESACLPDSHFCLRTTTGMWDLERGCKAEPNCYGDQFDATAGSLKPQISAPLSASAWLAGRDLAMEAVKKELGGR